MAKGISKRPVDRHQLLVSSALASLERKARKPGVGLTTERACADWFRLRFAECEHEVFAAAWLDIRRRLIAFDELFRGSLDGVSVSVREVVKSGLRHNAAAVFFAHNHPSGDPTVSAADLDITGALASGLAVVDIQALDHFIVTAHNRPVSLRRLMESALRAKPATNKRRRRLSS